MLETIQTYSIHGEMVVVTGADPAIMNPIGKFLRYFEQSCEHDGDGLQIHFTSVRSREAIPLVLPSLDWRIESHQADDIDEDFIGAWQCDVYACEGILTVDLHRNGMLSIDYRQGIGRGYLVNPETFHADIRVSYFHFVLTELLKRQGLYTLHATALEKEGRGVLIPGFSGRGKTTACISLLRSGYRCLSDDHPLMKVDEGQIRLLGFPEKVDVTDRSRDFFPELGESSQDKLHQGFMKKYFYIEDIYPGGTAFSCKPRVLILPHIVEESTSHVEPISKRQALEEILPHGLLVYDKTIAQKEFQVLSALIQTVDTYRLFFGKDVLELHRVIEPLIARFPPSQDDGERQFGVPPQSPGIIHPGI
jgi:hypothetical protein